MSNAHIVNEARIGGREGSGDAAAPGAAGLLSLAAAPTFAAMALWTGVFGSQSDILCTGPQSGSPLGGMTLMYLLMSAFHLAPWLKLASSRPSTGPAAHPGAAGSRQRRRHW